MGVASKWLFIPGLSSGSPEIAKFGTPATLRVHNFLNRPLIENRSCSLHWELSNGVSHATCTQGNRVDSRLFVIESQIVNLTFDLSFGHNLCCKCANGSWEPILDIYASINFQWYKELFKVRGFDLCNYSLNFRESIGTPTPNMGVHLGVWEFIITLSHTFESLSWPNLLQTLALLASPKLRLRH